MDRIKIDTPLATVLSYISESRYLVQRGFRSEATIRNTFWKSLIAHMVFDSNIIGQQNFSKKFLHIFVNVEASLKSLEVYFSGMSRQFWELNKSEIDNFFLDQIATSHKILIEITGHLEKLSITYKDEDNISFKLDSIQSEGKRSGQPVSEIILSNYPSELTFNNETEIFINDGIKNDEIKRIQNKMMNACKAQLNSLIYDKYFLPFSKDPHLPFPKTH